jgi:glycosyltransferase involved in cell wall biosynthesis
MPRIAVVTPYHREPVEVLAECHQSVLAQQGLGDVQVDHIMVADGFPRDDLAAWKIRHVQLPHAHGDYGCVARGLGSTMADAEGYDFIAYLDADNWFHPGHLASLVDAHGRTGAPVVSSFRSFHKPDGTRMEVTEIDEDQLQHVDTSCFLLHRSVFEVLQVWTRMPPRARLISDRVFLGALRHARFAIFSTRERTVAYRTLYETHYTAAGLPLPAGYKPQDVLKPAIDWLATKEGVTESVERLGFWPLSYV